MKKNIMAVVLLLIFSVSFAAVKNSGSKRYDMSYVDADFQAVFHAISELAGIDIIPAPDVSGRLSMTVTKKTWSEILDIVCSMYDLIWLKEGSYITIQRMASYQNKKIRDSEKSEQEDMIAPLSRRSFQIRHASAGEMLRVLETIKSSRGRISVVDRNNAIIVYDTKRRLEQMQSTLNELDVETLQIVITAKLVVVDSRLANELGVDWSGGSGSPITVGGSRLQAGFSNLPSLVSEDATTKLTVKAFDQNMEAKILNILSDSRSEILASPQISALDHTGAQIFMGDQISIPQRDVNGNVAYQMVESGIKLTVTPHVAGDNRILLELHTENNSYGFDQGQVVINKQEAQTKVVVSDGETVVIGGLTKNDEIETETGIPLLKDIPILGYLFKHNKKEVNKRDLIIFVTPRIMRNYLELPDAKLKKATSTEEYIDDGQE